MEKKLTYRNNSISVIRLIAALQVLLGHVIEHFELTDNKLVFKSIFFFRGVPIFFVISGFLMWFSIIHSKSYRQYLTKRFWRIYPELWVAVIVEVVVLVILYHGWNVKDLALFTLGQGTLFQFWTPDSLRGYGVGTPNGTLWTIGVMIQFYIIAWFFYKLMKKQKLGIWVVGLIISFCISWIGDYVAHNLLGREIIGKLYDQTFIKYFWLFYIGMFMAQFQEQLLPILKKYWYILLAIAVIFFITGVDLFSGYYFFWSLFLTAGLIGFAYRFPQLSVKLDISYGLFLYHMTVVNVFFYFGLIGSWLYLVPVVVLSMTIAYLSTVTIGILSSRRKERSIS